MSNSIDIINYLTKIANEKKINHSAVNQAFTDAITKIYTRNEPDMVLEIKIDIDNKIFAINRLFTIVGDDQNDYNDITEIPLSEAKVFEPNAEVGGIFKKPVDPNKFDRLAINNMAYEFRKNISHETASVTYSK
jgi:N utilization substance protein A